MRITLECVGKDVCPTAKHFLINQLQIKNHAKLKKLKRTRANIYHGFPPGPLLATCAKRANWPAVGDVFHAVQLDRRQSDRSGSVSRPGLHWCIQV